MKQRLLCLLLVSCFFAYAKTAIGSTWYVRADGGTRYSANVPTGQCDGLADAAYPGGGVNQHCAFGDYRFLWDDQSYGNSGWVIAGGDTVILDNTKQWRVGFDGAGGSTDAWCYGGSGPYNCLNPSIPAGTAAQHTRILGRNYANCSVNGLGDPAKMTQIFGGHGVYTALNLKGAQYLDVECVEITRHSQCITHGSPAFPGDCSKSVPIDDFDSDGIQTDVNTHDVLLQDLWIHGHTDRGIIGPVGGKITANRVDIGYNGMAGWDFDNGGGTPSVNGSLILSHSIIEWNGCNQEYPIVHMFPAISCYDDQSGGYGDGIGTPSLMGMNVAIDHTIFRYNTQDGQDFGHIDTDTCVGGCSLSVTDSYSYGNMGGQFKWGPAFATATFANNLAVGNCLRMSQPIAGAPSTFNAALTDYCRAQDALSFDTDNNASLLFADNTIVTYAPTTFDIQCNDSSGCANTVWTIENNIVRGYDNPTTHNMGGQVGGPGTYCGADCNSSTSPIGTINRSKNSYFGVRNCPAGNPAGSIHGAISGETCSDPLFVGELPSWTNEAALDNYNFNLSSGSPAISSGIAVPGLTTDYAGSTRLNPPSLGAIQYGGVPAVPAKAATAMNVLWTDSTISGDLSLTLNITAAGGGSPTGTVAVSWDGYLLETVPVPANDAIDFTIPLWADTLTFTVNYSGDANYLPSSFAVVPR